MTLKIQNGSNRHSPREKRPNSQLLQWLLHLMLMYWVIRNRSLKRRRMDCRMVLPLESMARLTSRAQGRPQPMIRWTSSSKRRTTALYRVGRVGPVDVARLARLPPKKKKALHHKQLTTLRSPMRRSTKKRSWTSMDGCAGTRPNAKRWSLKNRKRPRNAVITDLA